MDRRWIHGLVRVFGFTTLVVFALPGAHAPVCHAQSDLPPLINDAVLIEDFGLTQRLNVGARPAGMAGTYVATADDVHALIYNPAGLARIRRIDFTLGFQHRRTTVNNIFYENEFETKSSSTTLDALAAAYPVPTYRGSLVFAGGVYRVMSSNLNILYRGVNENTDYYPGRYDDYYLQQSGSLYSYTFGAGVDLSPGISVGANLFILDGTVRALTQFWYELPGPLSDGDLQSLNVADDAEADLDGYGMMVGLQYHPHSVLHFGLGITTPIKINLKGNAIQENTYYYYNRGGEFYSDQFILETDFRIPFRLDAGVSFTPPHLVVSLDASYADWKQAEVNGVQLKDEDLNAVFTEVLDLRAGAELLLPILPVRLRAGYAWIPYALEYLQADRIFMDDIQKAEVETQRQMISVGAGVLIGRVLTLDASYERQMGKRSIPSLVDERTSDRVVFSGSYRF